MIYRQVIYHFIEIETNKREPYLPEIKVWRKDKNNMSEMTQITSENIAKICTGYSHDYDAFVIITHSGVHHADDVMCVALMRYIVSNHLCTRMYTLRTNRSDYSNLAYWAAYEDSKDDEEHIAYILVDVGCGDFDHHQDPEYRDNGVEYASLGKLWRAVGPTLAGYAFTDQFDKFVAEPIDACDTGAYGRVNPLTMLISAFNPFWNEDDSFEARDKAFEHAVNLAYELIDRYFSKIQASFMARKEVAAIYYHQKAYGHDVRLLILDRFIPIGGLLANNFSDVLLVISPSSRNESRWNIHTVRDPKCEGGNRLSLPDTWSTETPPGCTYILPGKFAEFTTKDEAVRAAYRILNPPEETETDTVGGGELMDRAA